MARLRATMTAVPTRTLQAIAKKQWATIDIEASLDADPEVDTEWFLVNTIGAGTQNLSLSIKGNFTWIRAYVRGFTGGTINSVTITY